MTDMRSNYLKAFMIVLTIIILVIFTTVIAANLLPNYESNLYYAKVDEEMQAKIESLKIENNYLIITTSGDASAYCVKTTRSTPSKNSLCFKQLLNSKGEIAVLEKRKYYVFIKDINENISNAKIINSGEVN